MKLSMLINRILIAADALFRAKQKSSFSSKEILIIFQQAFGDAVILQNSLHEYTKIFPRTDGYNIKLIAQPSVLKFMQECLPLPEEIEYESVDFKKFLNKYSYYKETVNKYSSKYSVIILPGASLSGEIFCTAVNSPRKIGLLRSEPVRKPFIMALFPKLAFTEAVFPAKEEMMLQRHRKLINYLWETTIGKKGDFKAELPQIIKKEKKNNDHYAVICPGASKAEKCWSVEKYSKIADYIVESLHIKVIICGEPNEKLFAEEIIKTTKFSDKIINHTGRTSFSDWSALIQYSDLVVGNDSATMHLAAASRVPGVCISGVYDKYQFFPYKVDNLKSNDILPVTVMKDMPCEWCRTIGYNAGYGNKECKKRINAGLCASCIDLISVDEVIEAINKAMGAVKYEFAK